MTADVQNWTRCPSTHCERAQECRSPSECSGAGGVALAAGWQPIETAPKDGTEVQLAGMTPDGPRVTAGFWLVPPATIIGDCGGECRCPEYGEAEAPLWMSNDGGFSDEWPATHWKPLSEHPAALSAPSPAATVAEGVAEPVENSVDHYAHNAVALRERDLAEAEAGKRYPEDGPSNLDTWAAFQAGALWQRQQSAHPTPSGPADARVLLAARDEYARLMGRHVVPAREMKKYDDLVREARNRLAAEAVLYCHKIAPVDPSALLSEVKP